MSMSHRHFVRFDVASDLAHFRRPYAITTALTFPIPPRTALCGLVGALLGLPKNDGLVYLDDTQAVFGFQLLAPLRTGHISLNLLDTKNNPSFRPKAQNPHTIMRYEIIREPRYRIWFSHQDLGPRLRDMLLEDNAHFTPSLGLAWMLCWFNNAPAWVEAEQIGETEQGVPPVTLVRANDIKGDIAWDDQSIYQRIRMPAEMQPDRCVTRYQEYILETTGQPVQAKLNTCWKLTDGTAFSPM